MAVSGSTSIDIDATPAQILDAIADVESMPSWSSIHKSVEVVDRHPDGRPKRVKMKASLLGISDDQVLDYTWSDTGVTWDLVESSQQKAQHAEYRLTETDKGTHVEFEMMLDPKAPVPGFIIKRGQKAILEMATKGLRDQVKS
ncbi:polyketide cyclase/dehydrase/lipid transport protein [Williamsia muralis]|uniref:Polyketide cyclase/dehydrase/lipid transport protein n=1 Tax=Williamsia marianensis TaxID=85044 RepID=A0A495K072_WILMA|nr:SRPBCC family protein [Williamsia muralis]RKR93902.1 polyketide cyclase/dehydrase/lipid transport protein [Williamsia muralis]